MTNSLVQIVDEISKSEIFNKLAYDAVNDIKNRAGREGQFLNWIEKLPNIQLENLDKMYDMVQAAKGDKYTDLAILGIGGSRHTTENITKLLGIENRVHFFSSVEPLSFERFINSSKNEKK